VNIKRLARETREYTSASSERREVKREEPRPAPAAAPVPEKVPARASSLTDRVSPLTPSEVRSIADRFLATHRAARGR
jgi:hypothetical protein